MVTARAKEFTNRAAKKSRLKLQYGISISDYDELFRVQGGRCAVCNIHQSQLTKELNVDHCHKTGKVRGLLCNNCNRGLGLLKDNIEYIENLLCYLTFNK